MLASAFALKQIKLMANILTSTKKTKVCDGGQCQYFSIVLLFGCYDRSNVKLDSNIIASFEQKSTIQNVPVTVYSENIPHEDLGFG